MNNKLDFDILGGTYRKVGDYLIPNIELSAEEKEIKIGIWGMRRKNYLIHNNCTLFSIMLSDGTIWKYLAETDKQAEEMFSRLVNDMAKAENVTEKLKEHDQLEWVRRMNNIHNRATEIVNNEIIYS